MSERSERALREALGAFTPDEPPDPAGARRRAADRRRGGQVVAGVAIALVLVAGVIGVPRLFPADQGRSASMERVDADSGGGQAQPEAGPPSPATPEDPAPDGWRTEYYRRISFEVPETWGYAMPPGGSWCATNPDGQPRPDQRTPYVWHEALVPGPAVGCPAMPDSLFTEHVSVREHIDHAEEPAPAPGWSVLTEYIGGTRIEVTSRDRDLAQRIVDSVRVEPRGAPCSPMSPIYALGARPPTPTDLSAIGDADHVVLCQYDPGTNGILLRATHVATGPSADELVAALRSAPVDNSESCDQVPHGGYPEIFVLVRVTAGGETHDVYVLATGCPDSARGMAGGIDDGTTLRLLTREACQQVLTPPIALFAGSGAVGRNCLG